MYKTKDDVNYMFLTAIKKEKAQIRNEGKIYGEFKALQNKSVKLLTKKLGLVPT